MNKRPDFKTFREEALKNPKVRAEYEALRPEFELIMKFIQHDLNTPRLYKPGDERSSYERAKQLRLAVA